MSERPADWSPVGLDVDPTPGDPVVVIQGGREYLRVAEAIGEAAVAAGRLELEGAESRAVDAVMEKKAGVIEEIRKAQDRYRVAGDALVDDGRTLEEVQQETLQALVDARSAQAEQFAAQQQAASFEDQARDMREDDARDELRQDAVRAQGRVEAAAVVIAAARDRVADAVAARNASAQRAMSRIAEITAGDGLDDGWWDDWGADAVAALASIADVVSQIAGVLALVTAFIPGLQAVSAALFAISAVAGAVSMIANLALAATGEKSWAEVGVAVATSALSVVGLGAAGAGAKLLSKAVLRPSTFNAIQKAVCKLPFGQCFIAGTLVHTPDGPRPIEDLRAGDKVWSRNPDTGTDEIQLVNETFVRTAGTLYRLSIGGHTVSTTAEHPFMVEGLGWIHAEYLRPGQRLVTETGTARLDAVEVERPDVPVTVYNIHVDNNHNYYVSFGEHPILVHNATHSNPVAAIRKGGAQKPRGEVKSQPESITSQSGAGARGVYRTERIEFEGREIERPSGMSAIFEPPIEKGATNVPDRISPPGYDTKLGHEKGHGISAQAGGNVTNQIEDNFYSQFSESNGSWQKAIENEVVRVVDKGGQTVKYDITPVYKEDALSLNDVEVPHEIHIRGEGSGGYSLDVILKNEDGLDLYSAVKRAGDPLLEKVNGVRFGSSPVAIPGGSR